MPGRDHASASFVSSLFRFDATHHALAIFLHVLIDAASRMPGVAADNDACALARRFS
jgi:hypothetical protein